MSIKLREINWSRIVFFLLFIIIVLTIFTIDVKNNNIDIAVILTFILIFAISIWQIIKDKTPYSLNKTFWYFNLIFYVLSPITQYLSNYNVWSYELNNQDYLFGNFMILISIFSYLAIYKRVKSSDIKREKVIHIEVKNYIVFFLFALSLLCFIIAIRDIGFANLFSRTENNYSLVGNSMFNSIFTHLLKCIPVYAFVITYYKYNKLNLITLLLLLEIFLLNFPTSTTRFWMGAIFIGLFLIIFNKKMVNNRIYDLLILITFTILFSFLYLFKFYDFNYILQEGVNFQSIAESYNSVDYDAFSIIPRTRHYVKNYDYVYGHQLLGTILFMIPRGIWPNKPVPSGQFIVETQNQGYTNISCPLISEAYLNFGVIGVIMFHLLLALICRKLDTVYWTKANKSIYLNFLYPFLLGFLLYFERGALHPATVYLFCFCIPLIFGYFINIAKKIRRGVGYVK